MPPAPRKPPALRPGDRVGIVATGSPVREELLAGGEAVLASLGYQPCRGAHVLARERYTAGSCDQRAADVNGFLRDPAIRALWVARGGYGTPPILPLLDAEAFARDPKPIIGSSDATALLLWALAGGVAALHGPMPARAFDEAHVDLDELRRHLSEPRAHGMLLAPGLRTLHPGRATAITTGGCLSLVTASLGTPWELATEGTLLFLEDIDTKPYQIDRMMTQLLQAGKLAGVAGILFGEMPGCVQTRDQGYTLDEVLFDLTASLKVPVVSGLPAGHTSGVHRALPLGIQATLDAGIPSLCFDQPLVS